MKTVLVRLVFPINAHQNANQKPIGSAPSYRVQCTLPPQPMCQTLLFDFSRVWFRDYFILGAVYTSTLADVPDPPFRFFEGLVPRLLHPNLISNSYICRMENKLTPSHLLSTNFAWPRWLSTSSRVVNKSIYPASEAHVV